MFGLFFVTGLFLLVLACGANWEGRDSFFLRFAVFVLGVSQMLNAAKTLAPNLNWGF